MESILDADILIVDDNKDLLRLLREQLASAGYRNLRTAKSCALAREAFQAKRPELMILDINLPDGDGFTLFRSLRAQADIPALFLSARDADADRLFGLGLGADDYLTKPFGINELMARVNSLIRRYTTLNPVTGNEAATMLLKDMVIDKINRTVTVQNLPVDLTGKEFDLLLFLASNKGRVFTKKQLYMQVWTEEYDFDDNNLMAFISKLRKKIEPNPEQPFYIQTVRGVGYRFNKEA